MGKAASETRDDQGVTIRREFRAAGLDVETAKEHMHACCCVRPCVTPRTVALQVSLSMGFSRPECQSGLPFPPPGDLPDPGIKPTSHIFSPGRWVLYRQRGLGSPRGGVGEYKPRLQAQAPCSSSQDIPSLLLQLVFTRHFHSHPVYTSETPTL